MNHFAVLAHNENALGGRDVVTTKVKTCRRSIERRQKTRSQSTIYGPHELCTFTPTKKPSNLIDLPCPKQRCELPALVITHRRRTCVIAFHVYFSNSLRKSGSLDCVINHFDAMMPWLCAMNIHNLLERVEGIQSRNSRCVSIHSDQGRSRLRDLN
jgi:hypothetical protein